MDSRAMKWMLKAERDKERQLFAELITLITAIELNAHVWTKHSTGHHSSWPHRARWRCNHISALTELHRRAHCSQIALSHPTGGWQTQWHPCYVPFANTGRRKAITKLAVSNYVHPINGIATYLSFWGQGLLLLLPTIGIPTIGILRNANLGK